VPKFRVNFLSIIYHHAIQNLPNIYKSLTSLEDLHVYHLLVTDRMMWLTLEYAGESERLFR